MGRDSPRRNTAPGRIAASIGQTGPRWLADDEIVIPAPEPVQPPLTAAASRRQAKLRAFGRTSLYLLPVLVALGVVLTVFALTVYRADRGNPISDPIPDPLANLPRGIQQELLNATFQLPAELKLTFIGKPQELCEELARLGLKNSGWHKALFSASRWQCVSDLAQLTTPSVDYGPATLFFCPSRP